MGMLPYVICASFNAFSSSLWFLMLTPFQLEHKLINRVMVTRCFTDYLHLHVVKL